MHSDAQYIIIEHLYCCAWSFYSEVFTKFNIFYSSKCIAGQTINEIFGKMWLFEKIRGEKSLVFSEKMERAKGNLNLKGVGSGAIACIGCKPYQV